jgi:arabinose-5-phosphate isomerase
MAPNKSSLKPVRPGAARAQDQRHADLGAADRVLSYAADALNAVSASLDGEFVHAIDIMLAAQAKGQSGRIIVSGMGKSGHVARKIAATLSSTGTPAHFVHPAEASHGDLGAIARQDVLLLLSWGGETVELGDLISYAKRFRIPVIGIASNAESTLMQAADVKLLLPRAPEACPNGLAPTTSTTVMLALGDALAVALMERKGFSPDQYRNFHPGGSLGRALIRVADLMHREGEIPLAKEEAGMREVLLTMASGRLGCVGVVNGAGALVGIVTDGDVRRHVGKDLESRKASEIMTRNPKIAHPGQLAVEAVAQMTESKITQLFVLEAGSKNKKPVGVLHIHDCLRAGLG